MELGNGRRKWLEMDLVCRRKWEDLAKGEGENIAKGTRDPGVEFILPK